MENNELPGNNEKWFKMWGLVRTDGCLGIRVKAVAVNMVKNGETNLYDKSENENYAQKREEKWSHVNKYLPVFAWETNTYVQK